MLTYGGREANERERAAIVGFVSQFSDEPQALRFPEIAVLETDDYGRVMVFLRVLQETGREEQLLLAFRALLPGGGCSAGPKAVLRVRESSFYAGLDHHKVRNSWNCPLETDVRVNA